MCKIVVYFNAHQTLKILKGAKTLQAPLYMHVWVHMCLCVEAGCVPPASCLSRQCRPKVEFQLYFMAAGSELATRFREIQTCQQQGCCFTAAMATSRHRCTNSTAQLYDCWPRCCRLICCWERPVAVRCKDADTWIFLFFFFSCGREKNKVGAWNEYQEVWRTQRWFKEFFSPNKLVSDTNGQYCWETFVFPS